MYEYRDKEEEKMNDLKIDKLTEENKKLKKDNKNLRIALASDIGSQFRDYIHNMQAHIIQKEREENKQLKSKLNELIVCHSCGVILNKYSVLKTCHKHTEIKTGECPFCKGSLIDYLN